MWTATKGGAALPESAGDGCRTDRVGILNRPGISDGPRAAVEEAVEGTPEEVRHFLEYGRYEVDAWTTASDPRPAGWTPAGRVVLKACAPR